MSTPERRPLRAPTEDGAALIDPPLAEAPKLIEHNRRVLAEFDRVSGLPADFRTTARRGLVLSTKYSVLGTRGANLAGSHAAIDLGPPIVVSGHQPELFHPGVWFKNFLLDAVAKRTGAVGINLIIDNDTVGRAAIRVPAARSQGAEAVEVPFDGAGPEVPWESRTILDDAVFRSFPAEVRRTMSSLTDSQAELLVDRLWPHVLAAREEEANEFRTLGAVTPAKRDLPSRVVPRRAIPPALLGKCLSEGRHRLERESGLGTREASLAAVCDGSFFAFSSLLFARGQELHAAYNAALAEYRQANRVRNLAQPMPDLSRDGAWYEAPFWLWRFDDPRRRKVFVRQKSAGWEITDREGNDVDSSAFAGEPDPRLAMIERGFVLRPRALVTTMYARLVLSDLFIHGIGGAKYDEVTDSIIRRLFGIEPPKFITASATFRLPIDRPEASVVDVRAIERRIRDARYRPESLAGDPLVRGDAALVQSLAALAEEKREYLMHNDLRRCEQEVFHRLDTINRAMHHLLAPVERELRARLARTIEEARAARVLGSREFSFVLFPAEDLPRRLLALCEVSA
jgi:hypothetical protein